MPPKKNEPGKKTVEKKKEKVIEVNYSLFDTRGQKSSMDLLYFVY